MTTGQADENSAKRADDDEADNPGLVGQVGLMARARWASPVRNLLLWLTAALFAVAPKLEARAQAGNPALSVSG